MYVCVFNPATWYRNELDGAVTRRQDKFPSPFKVIIELTPSGSSSPNKDIAWQNLPHPLTTPIACFSTLEEQGEVTNLFGGNIN